eukprot:3362204-Pleurochrysis_carterae.AAC.1
MPRWQAEYRCARDNRQEQASNVRRRPAWRDRVSNNSGRKRAISSKGLIGAVHGGHAPPCGRARRTGPPTAA